ncbi:MAG: DUF4442 domain-containing protein [Bdellovibrionales bacterium CG10_big_fil_rev_8_21_14_0_10_45_34]|nr:MAG: DUF4442 domain-containing protein [Bdellovibrionales bacterium CG10_big_fil_rev_8_21_14_0_10_45_34]
MKLPFPLNPDFEQIKQTLRLNAFSIWKIPLIFITQPRVIELSESACKLKMPLNYWTKNHLGSMYFGALSIGADCAAGLFALHIAEKRKIKISFVFASFMATFHKRPEGPVVFVCEDSIAINRLFDKAVQTKERQTELIEIRAYLEGQENKEPVASFSLGLSIKVKN